MHREMGLYRQWISWHEMPFPQTPMHGWKKAELRNSSSKFKGHGLPRQHQRFQAPLKFSMGINPFCCPLGFTESRAVCTKPRGASSLMIKGCYERMSPRCCQGKSCLCRTAETPRIFGGPQVEAGGGEGRPYACLAAAEPSQRAHSSSRSPGDRTPAGLWPGSRSCVQSREETAEIDSGGGRKVRGNEALHVCSMMLFTLPSFYLLLATSLLALSSHHRRRLVFAYTASPGPVSNPRRRLAGRLCVFVSFSEQLLCRALCRPPPPAPSLFAL